MPRIGRRTVLAGAIGAAAVPVRASADAPTPGQPRDRNRLWYRQPAIAWTEALPVGNGHVGAMIFGGIAQERLQLNHNRLSAGAPYQADNPDALEALPRVRALIDAGQYAQAEALAGARMMGRPLTQMPYGALGDLLIDFDNACAAISKSCSIGCTARKTSACSKTSPLENACKIRRKTASSAVATANACLRHASS